MTTCFSAQRLETACKATNSLRWGSKVHLLFYSPTSPASSFSTTFPTIIMRNKPRLHLALYTRPKSPDTYHYALLLRPKSSNAPAALKFHVYNKLPKGDDIISQPWLYETTDIPDISLEPRLLACIVIEKILVPLQRVNQILREVPIHQVEEPGGGLDFDCVKWIRLAILALRRADAVSNNGFTWDGIREEALRYMRRKKQERRWEAGWKGGRPGDVATFDMLTGEEVVP